MRNVNSGLELYDSGPLEKKKPKLELQKFHQKTESAEFVEMPICKMEQF